MRFLVLVLSLAALVVGLSAAPPHAVEAKCYPARNNDGVNYAVAEFGYLGYPTAVTSTLLNYDPYVIYAVHPATGTIWGQISAAWVMIAGSPGYAQVGWAEFTKDWRYTFYEYTTSYPNYYRRLIADSANPYPEGVYAEYEVYLDDVIPGYFTFRAGWPRTDGSPTPAVGYGLRYFTPDHVEIAGEITSLGNQLAGGRAGSANEYFYGNWARSYGTWYPWTGIRYNSDPVNFSYLDVPEHPVWRGGAFAIFDNACQY